MYSDFSYRNFKITFRQDLILEQFLRNDYYELKKNNKSR